jgi:hypothetical protein
MIHIGNLYIINDKEFMVVAHPLPNGFNYTLATTDGTCVITCKTEEQLKRFERLEYKESNSPYKDLIPLNTQVYTVDIHNPTTGTVQSVSVGLSSEASGVVIKYTILLNGGDLLTRMSKYVFRTKGELKKFMTDKITNKVEAL